MQKSQNAQLDIKISLVFDKSSCKLQIFTFSHVDVNSLPIWVQKERTKVKRHNSCLMKIQTARLARQLMWKLQEEEVGFVETWKTRVALCVKISSFFSFFFSFFKHESKRRMTKKVAINVPWRAAGQSRNEWQ